MTLLDSNAIIYLSKRVITVDEIFIDNEEYAISVITYMEVLGYSFESEEEEDFIHNFLKAFKIIYIDDAIANKVIMLRKIHKIKLPDAIICASCLVNSAILVTNDIRLKNIPDLKIRQILS